MRRARIARAARPPMWPAQTRETSAAQAGADVSARSSGTSVMRPVGVFQLHLPIRVQRDHCVADLLAPGARALVRAASHDLAQLLCDLLEPARVFVTRQSAATLDVAIDGAAVRDKDEPIDTAPTSQILQGVELFAKLAQTAPRIFWIEVQRDSSTCTPSRVFSRVGKRPPQDTVEPLDICSERGDRLRLVGAAARVDPCAFISPPISWSTALSLLPLKLSLQSFSASSTFKMLGISRVK